MKPLETAGLDLSLVATGCAWPDGSVSKISTSPKQPLPERLRFIRHTITTKWDELCLHRTVAIVEDLPFTRNNAAGQLGMVHGVVRVALDDLVNRGLCAGVVLVVPGSLKRYACGNGNANKQQMLAAAIRRLDYQGADDNEADALWLRQLGLAHYAPDHAVTMPMSHQEALRGVTWLDIPEAARV